MTALLECYEFSVSASDYKHIQKSRFNKLPIYAYCITHIDTFKLDVYVSQLYFNVINKVAIDILYSTKVPQWEDKQI